MKRFSSVGLFVIPIRFALAKSVYTDYLDFLCSAEQFGYSHIFLGEHLTDPHEDIQSSIVFAAAILARTKKIKVALSVLPLPHYNIPVLIKQLEDLYQLSNGRLMIGFSPGALETDAHYVGFDPKNRYPIFCSKLSEFIEAVEKSNILSKISKNHFFSTLLAPMPVNSVKLFDSGFSALSSNFTHQSLLINHISCLTKGETTRSDLSYWHIGCNVIPDLSELLHESNDRIFKTLDYIYSKLTVNASSIMLAEQNNSELLKNPQKYREKLIEEQITDITSVKITINELETHYPNVSGVTVVNLFDCLDDICYTKQIQSIPSLLHE